VRRARLALASPWCDGPHRGGARCSAGFCRGLSWFPAPGWCGRGGCWELGDGNPGEGHDDHSFPLTDIDTATPHPARIYDYLLGGKDNYPADKEAARQLLKAAPEVRDSAVANRAFLRRVVRYLAGEAGIRHFIDVGTGIPTAPNVHEVAAAAAPGTRVAYVDNDRCKSSCAHTR
jgi:hypothetical protein